MAIIMVSHQSHVHPKRMCFRSVPTYLKSQLLEFPGYSGRMMLLLLLRFFLSLLTLFLFAGPFGLLKRNLSVLPVFTFRLIFCTRCTCHHSASALEWANNTLAQRSCLGVPQIWRFGSVRNAD